jgi:uncharacterized protein (TIGR00369 family)
MSNLIRQHTFTWQDPLTAAEIGRTLSGLEYLKKIRNGELPPAPILALMNGRLIEVSEGRAVFEANPTEYHYNPIGSVHGGFAATLLDSAMASAVHSRLPAGVGSTTLEIKVNYIRPLAATTGSVRCEGIAIHVGMTTATAEGRITDSNGKLYAHGTTTCLVLHR